MQRAITGEPKRVAVYYRISTDEGNQPFSLAAQSDRLHAYITSQDGWSIVAEYQDQMSGAKLDRPGLQQALKDAKLGRFDLLLVYRVDRLSRSVTNLISIIDTLTEYGVEFCSATEAIDTSTPAGRLMLSMVGSFAEYERSITIDRVINGLLKKAQSGGWTGGRPPIGYTLNKGELVIDRDYAPIVRLVFEQYAHEKAGSQTICHYLNEAGHRAPSGKPFSFKQVLRMINNRTYIGEIFFQNTWYPGRHESIIEPELFAEAQQLLAERSEHIGKRANNASSFLLSGIVRCVNCGRHLTGTTAHGRSNKYRYYTCSGLQRYGKTECTTDRLPAHALEQAVMDQLINIFTNTDLVDEAIGKVADNSETIQQQLHEELATIDTAISKQATALDKYLRAFEDGALSPAICGERINDIDQQLKALNHKRLELEHQLDQPASVPSQQDLSHLRTNIEHAIRNGGPKHQKQLLQALVHEVNVTNRQHIQPVFRIPTGTEVKTPVRADSQKVEAPGIEPGSSETNPSLLRA